MCKFFFLVTSIRIRNSSVHQARPHDRKSTLSFSASSDALAHATIHHPTPIPTPISLCSRPRPLLRERTRACAHSHSHAYEPVLTITLAMPTPGPVPTRTPTSLLSRPHPLPRPRTRLHAHPTKILSGCLSSCVTYVRWRMVLIFETITAVFYSCGAVS